MQVNFPMLLSEDWIAALSKYPGVELTGLGVSVCPSSLDNATCSSKAPHSFTCPPGLCDGFLCHLHEWQMICLCSLHVICLVYCEVEHFFISFMTILFFILSYPFPFLLSFSLLISRSSLCILDTNSVLRFLDVSLSSFQELIYWTIV
jgi:hypothetical protein